MVISEEKQFVFVHVWKSGGTSVAKALTNLCPDTNLPEPVGKRILSQALRVTDKLNLTHHQLGKHAYAVDIRGRVGAEKFDGFHSFGFVRNPWDWLVSWYNFVNKTRTSPDTGKPWTHHLYPYVHSLSFSEYIDWVIQDQGLNKAHARRKSSFANRPIFLQKDWLSDLDGNLLVDFVGKYENLQQDFDTICATIQLPQTDLPHLNQGASARYKEYYDAETAEKVAEYFADDIEAFDYSF